MDRASTESNVLPSLLLTNLRIPQLPGELVSRSRLIKKLDQALGYPLTLLSAPAGFGKTTLLIQWIASNDRAKLKNRIAWISLDGDCDLRQFWTYILVAMQEIQSGIGKSILSLLELPQQPIYTILRTLINEISAIAEDFVLILDDYHLVDDPTIHTTLTYFINHLPSNLHLVIASRSQPPLSLARWRASNHLFELREKDLRLTYEEIGTFFNEINGLNLSQEDMTALEARTEGWIASLQLVALSMHGFDDELKHNFVSTFTGSQRYILDYLVEEVLQRQTENMRIFLLRTSVLERMNALLCNVVTGLSDGQATLERLERAQLFTIPLDQERHWYRYHHLFRDVLYHELSQTEPESVLDLHRRAAEWYINAGQTDDAIRHACAAHEWDQAIDLIEVVVGTAWDRGEVRKIIDWLGRVPSKNLDSHPNLLVYFIRALLHGGQMRAGEQQLREAEALLRSRVIPDPGAEDRLLLGAICAFRALVTAVSSEPARALLLGREALNLLPSEHKDLRAYSINSIGVAYYYLGNMSDAKQALAEAGELARNGGNLFPMLVAMSYQAKALVCQGQLRQAGFILQQALSQGEIPNHPISSWLPAASYACVDFGNLLYEWNRLEEAERYLTEAIELGQQLAFGSALWSAYHALMRIRLVHGDQEEALAMIHQAQQYQRMHSLPINARLMEAIQARAWLALGQKAEVESWARTRPLEGMSSPGFVQEYENITLARFYLLQDKPGRAVAILDKTLPIARSGERHGHVIEILSLTALAQHKLGDTRLAINTLHTTLKMAEPEGYLRTFVDAGKPMAALLHQTLAWGVMPDYVSRLLAAFTAGETVASSSPDNPESHQTRPIQEYPIEPLSPRELEVLQLMAGGASNQIIAAELVIAMTTAKKHVSNVIQKLGVENRTQAAAKGRNLGLCQ